MKARPASQSSITGMELLNLFWSNSAPLPTQPWETMSIYTLMPHWLFRYWGHISPATTAYSVGGWHFISLNANAQESQSVPVPHNTKGCSRIWLPIPGLHHVYYHEPLFNIGRRGLVS